MQNQSLNNCYNIPSQQSPNAVNINIIAPAAYAAGQGGLKTNTQSCPNGEVYSVYGKNSMPNLPLYPSNYNNFINYPNASTNPIGTNVQQYQNPMSQSAGFLPNGLNQNQMAAQQGYVQTGLNPYQIYAQQGQANSLNPNQIPNNQIGYMQQGLMPEQMGYGPSGLSGGYYPNGANSVQAQNAMNYTQSPINTQPSINDGTKTSEQQHMYANAGNSNNLANNSLNNTNYTEKIEKTETTKTETNNKKEKTVIPLTDEYVKNLENYLNSDNSKIRLIGAKELMQRFKEDESRKDNRSLVPLLNKSLKDKSPSVRFLALTALQLGYSVGDDETVSILNKIANENQDKFGQDAILASEILLKLSAPQAVKADKGGKS